MTTIVKILIALVMSLFFTSCMFDIEIGNGKKGNGNVVTEERNSRESFTEVEASEGLDVYVIQDDRTEIRVEADENVIDMIRTDIRNGVLVIHTDERIGRATKNIYVSVPEITRLESNSGADLYGKGVISGSKIMLDAHSGADLEVELDAEHIAADASSGADIRVSGKADYLVADASSGADIKARGLEVNRCDADASSGADISVNVTESLTANASSGADITYSGNPHINSHKSSAGSISKH